LKVSARPLINLNTNTSNEIESQNNSTGSQLQTLSSDLILDDNNALMSTNQNSCQISDLIFTPLTQSTQSTQSSVLDAFSPNLSGLDVI